MALRLHLTHVSEADCLVALEFGRVDEGQFAGCWRALREAHDAQRDGARIWYLHDGPQGPEVGFKALGLSMVDLEAAELAELWVGPRFDAPTLGLAVASAAEILLAARALFAGRPSVNHEFFMRAVEASGEEAVGAWECCLEAGDAMAHYGLGVTLLELGRCHEAYRHLRYYTELAPAGSWAWCAYGRAAESLGQDGEARTAYRRAIELEERGGPHTDAEQLLARLAARRRRRRRPRPRRS
jgi:tetratricopeptide (TPR) repeat protein